MAITEKTFTYQEYLNCQEHLETHHELVAGKIIAMPPESPLNVQLAFKLMLLLIENFGVARVNNKTEIIVSGSRVTARIPDIVLFSEAGAREIQDKTSSTIDIDMLPPLLVVEVVSPGKEARDRDYRYKRSEYAARGIEHYWIVDPQEKMITFLQLVDGAYQERIVTLQEQKIDVTHPLISEAINLEALFS